MENYDYNKIRCDYKKFMFIELILFDVSLIKISDIKLKDKFERFFAPIQDFGQNFNKHFLI